MVRNMSGLLILCGWMVGAGLDPVAGRAAEANRLVIHVDQGAETISRHIYGHFSEHLGGCIYGGFWVGPDSSIPNTRGIRNDVVAALRKLNIPVLRWPGGCFADEYHWKDGIGPRSQRPSMVNTHWGSVTENNHFGTHEFLDLCKQLDCEPYICGNVGSGTVTEMQQWVEYITLAGQSPMSNLRRANGRDEPWKLIYFGVGNENWGCGGSMRAEFYADLYRRYQTYVRNLSGNRVYKIACGGAGADFHWTEVLMREAGGMMAGLSYHNYTVPGGWGNKNSATHFEEGDWFETMQKSLMMDAYMAKHGAIMDKYDPEKRVGMIVDEWGTWYQVEPGTNPGFLYQQNSLRDAVSAGLHLNIFNQHCARVKMANIAQTVNVLQAMILTDGPRMTLTPTYHVFEMYKVHHDATLLPIDLQCRDYRFADEAMTALSVSASRNAAGTVHISLCNLDAEKEVELSCQLQGMRGRKVSGRVLTAPVMTAHNTFEGPDAVEPEEFDAVELQGSRLTMTVPSKSVVVLAVE